jgi:hypothetical protein
VREKKSAAAPMRNQLLVIAGPPQLQATNFTRAILIALGNQTASVTIVPRCNPRARKTITCRVRVR